MRKALLIIGLLAAFSFTAAAENLVIVQGSYLNTGTSYEAEFAGRKHESAWSMAAWGSTLSGYFGVGGDVGVLTSLGVYFPTWYFITEPQDRDGEIEDGGLVLAGDVGAGWKLDVADSPVSFLLGAGAHLNHWTLYPPDDSDADSTSETVLGLSAQALPMIEAADGFYVAAGLKLAWHFLFLGSDPDKDDDVDYTGAIDLSASFGGGFRF